LCEPFPDSPEYASALADLSECHSWTDSFDAALRYAEEAVQAAHRSGSHEALARAYRARSYARPRDKRADQDSAEALSQARMHSDPGLLTAARVGRQNYLADRGQLADTIELDAAGLSDALDTGVVNLAAYHAGALARSLLIVGRFSEANRTIRQGLGLARMPHNGAQVRLAAAQLAVRQGDLSRAGMHLRRAKELMPDLEERPNLFSPPTIAEYLVASGRPAEALELLARTLAVQIADPRVADEMLMWAARSAADLAEHAADRRDGGGLTQARRLLDDIVSLRKGLAPPPFERLTTEDLILPAFEALYAAENARCRARTPMSAIWEHATHRCASAGMRWEEAVASYRWAQALLTESAGRAAFAGPLRSAYSLAVELGATPLQQQAETLAGLGKLALDEPKEPSIQEIPETFRALTQREREILSHLVAGRTYAEIADSLFISKKTVSVHVSNLLRKTGTSSRLEVSAIAARLGYP